MDFSTESSTLMHSTMPVHSMKTSPSSMVHSTMPAHSMQTSIVPTRTYTQQMTTPSSPLIEDSEEAWQIAVYTLIAALGK